ncbi:hypothetical protein ACLB2K_068517 [Fragaria x ananassa]
MENEALDVSKIEGGAPKLNAPHLLARLLASSLNLHDLRQDRYATKKGYRVHQCSADRFLITFDLMPDRNKVIRGGP